MSSFHDLGLPADLLSAVDDLGFVEPTEIQTQAIPELLAQHDVVGVAQTGTGKTAAFGLPMLAALDGKPGVQALVLSPTRELAMQTSKAITDFAHRSRGAKVVAVYGGSAYGPQISAIKQGAQVVVGTPGRIMDLMERGALDFTGVKFFVLDEADEMLRMGFAEDVETIASQIPAGGINALFSATMPPAIKKVADKYLQDPVEISISPQSSTVDTVHQTYAVVPFKYKSEALSRALATCDAQAAIVFVRTRVDAEEIATELMGWGFKAAALSGDVAQRERERIISRLREGTLDVLVATDVAARGLDVDRIGLVVNYDVPRESEAYVHRIGRTGRAGREGLSLTFFTPRERSRLRQIERLTGTAMQEILVPSPLDVSAYRCRKALDAVPDRLDKGKLELYFRLLSEITSNSTLDIVDIAAALLARVVGDEGTTPRSDKGRSGKFAGRVRREETVDEDGAFVSAIFEEGRDKSGRDKPRKDRDRGDRGRKDRRSGSARRESFSQSRKYRVEVGKRDGVKPGAIVGAITNEGGVAGTDLGHIEIFPSFSVVEINGSLSDKQTKSIAKARVSGRALRIREDQGPRTSGSYKPPRKNFRR